MTGRVRPDRAGPVIYIFIKPAISPLLRQTHSQSGGRGGGTSPFWTNDEATVDSLTFWKKEATSV